MTRGSIGFGAGMRLWLGLITILVGVWAGPGHADETVKARWVADGDTIVLQDGRRVRYIGIDAPEIDHTNGRPTPLGHAARSLNRRLVDGWQLRLVYDQETSDRFGRVLAYVYRGDGLFINAELLRQGHAHFLYHPPNVRHADILLAAQRAAMESGRGIWRFVQKEPAAGMTYPGNRRSRRFHAHDCSMAKKISAANRVWFQNQWEAFWSGFAPAKECIPFPPER